MALALSDYQFNYATAVDTLTFGPNGATVPNVDIEEVSGLEDLDVRVGDREFARQDGDISGLHRAEFREIRFKIEVRSSVLNQTYYDLVTKTREIFTRRADPSDTDGVLTFKLPGEPEQIIRCRPIRRRESRNARTEYGLLPMEILLRAADPRIYAVDTDTSTTNNGNDFAYPILNFGAVTSASITNSTTGDTISISSATGSGNLIADMDKWVRGTSGLIVYRGSTDNYFAWDLPRRPFRLAPGANSISGSGYSLTKRHTWL
jgi:hypothetical protein